LKNLYNEWLRLKEKEEEAKADRREIEDKILAQAPDHTGFKVSIIERNNVKVDSDKLQEIAQENGLTDHLGHLFRWKASINQKDWKAADESITTPLLDAITTTPGRASFKIERIEEK
jgi:hypothetical protein